MKTILVGAVALLAAVGVVIWEESRIAALKQEIAALKGEQLADGGSGGSGGMPAKAKAGGPANSGPAGKSERPDLAGTSGNRAAGQAIREEGDRALGETIRKMFENPAGRAMINVENRMRAATLYAGLLEQFDLNKEEEDYLIDLLAPGIGEEDAVGMKLMAAKSEEEAAKILDDMEAAQAARRKAVEEFLNSDEDLAKYERYQERKSEHEQMPGIRSVMKGAGAPLDADTEAALVEAMFAARTESGITERWEGRAGFEQFAEPGVSKRFEDDWAKMQESLDDKTGAVLNETQVEALGQQQDQVKDFVLMGIRMAETMIEAGQK